MLSDFFFVMKMLGFTVLVAIFMQVKIGEHTIDEHFSQWIKTSTFVDYAQEAVDGAIGLTKDGYKKAHSVISYNLDKVKGHHSKTGRDLNVKLQRYYEKSEEWVDDAKEELPELKARWQHHSQTQTK